MNASFPTQCAGKILNLCFVTIDLSLKRQLNMLIHLFDQSNSHAQSHNTVGMEGFRVLTFFPQERIFCLIWLKKVLQKFHGKMFDSKTELLSNSLNLLNPSNILWSLLRQNFGRWQGLTNAIMSFYEFSCNQISLNFCTREVVGC